MIVDDVHTRWRIKSQFYLPDEISDYPHLPRYYQKSAEAYLDKALNSFLICPPVLKKASKGDFYDM